jgi:hypothetical protein
MQVRVSAALALWNIAHLTNGIPALREGLVAPPLAHGPDWQICSAYYLHLMDTNDLSLIPIFTNKFSSAAPWRDMAIRALGDYGAAAESAVPSLEAIMEGNDSELKREALESLKKIDPAAAAKYEKQ